MQSNNPLMDLNISISVIITLVLVCYVNARLKRFEILADVEDYNGIRDRSSTEKLNHSGLYK